MTSREKILTLCKLDFFIQQKKPMPLKLTHCCDDAYLTKNFDSLFLMVSSQMRIWLFIELMEELDDASYFQYLGEVMTFTYTSFDPQLFLYLLQHPLRDPVLRKNIMSDEENTLLQTLPSTVTLFRGNIANKPPGFSWSLSKEIALPFATRHYPHPGELLIGTCLKSKIITYFSREEEILVNPKDVLIQQKTTIEADTNEATIQRNQYRFKIHQQIWQQIKKSTTYIKIKKEIQNGF